MTKTQTYLYRLIVQGSLVWAASIAAMSGQTTSSNASQAFTSASVNPIGVKGEFTGAVGCGNYHKHDKAWDSFYNNPHFKRVASGKEPPERTGCEGCHGLAARGSSHSSTKSGPRSHVESTVCRQDSTLY